MHIPVSSNSGILAPGSRLLAEARKAVAAERAKAIWQESEEQSPILQGKAPLPRPKQPEGMEG